MSGGIEGTDRAVSPAPARDGGEALAQAIAAGHAAYDAGDWAGAASAWELAATAGADSAALHFDLGNAHYRAGAKGEALLFWERALRRDPADEAAAANLELVRAELRQRPEPPFLERLGARVDPDAAAAGLVVGFSLACTFLIARRLGRARAALALLAALSLLAAAGAGAGLAAALHLRGTDRLIALDAGKLRRAPAASAQIVAEACEGAHLERLGALGAWARVRTPGGAEGWIEEALVAPIELPR